MTHPLLSKVKQVYSVDGQQVDTFPVDLWEGIVLQLPCRLTASLNTVFR